MNFWPNHSFKYGAVIPNGLTDTGADIIIGTNKGNSRLNKVPPLGSIIECARLFGQSNIVS